MFTYKIVSKHLKIKKANVDTNEIVANPPPSEGISDLSLPPKPDSGGGCILFITPPPKEFRPEDDDDDNSSFIAAVDSKSIINEYERNIDHE